MGLLCRAGRGGLRAGPPPSKWPEGGASWLGRGERGASPGRGERSGAGPGAEKREGERRGWSGISYGK